MSYEITRRDITALALGSAVLGTGGGGNSYYGQLVASRLLADDASVRVIGIDEMDPASFAITLAAIGAPLVCLEKPPSMLALQSGFESVRDALKGPVGAFFTAEIGGLQCMFPLLLGAQCGLPILDGDSIGRAFPELQMSTLSIYGTTHGLPSALSGDRGLLMAGVPKAERPRGSSEPPGIERERAIRRMCAENGGLIYMTAAHDYESMHRTLIRGTISLSLKIGRAIETARANHEDPQAAICNAAEGKRFVGGKVVDVQRTFRAGHDWGNLVIEGVDDDRGRRAAIDFKNEYLILKLDGAVVLTVPDLITLVETDSGAPVSTEILRPGLRVTVLGLPCSPLMRTERALRSVGPAAFGYDLTYTPLNPEKN
jgi:uncharacterized protein